MKHDLLIIPIILIIIISIFGTFKLLEILDYKSSLSNLKEYNILKNEKIQETIRYDNKEYIITSYLKEGDSYTTKNILLKEKNKYYFLKEIPKCECDNIYIKNNEIYLHCIGKKANIDKYTINEFEITEETLNLNLKDVPQISDIHIIVEKVDYNSIYIYTHINEYKAKCTFKNYSYKCEYYE